MRRHPQRLARALTLLAAAWFVLWACAPPTSLPPPAPMASAPTDLGATLSLGLAPDPVWLANPDGSLSYYLAPRSTVEVQGWLMVDRNEARCQAGALIFVGTTTAPGAGGVLRCDLASSSQWYLGPQVEAGWLWTGIGVPVGYLARPDLLLYTTPTFRFVAGQPLLLPIGVAWHTEGQAWVSAEAGFRGGKRIEFLEQLGYNDAQVAYLAVGVNR